MLPNFFATARKDDQTPAPPAPTAEQIAEELAERLNAALDALAEAHQAFTAHAGHARDRAGAWSIERLSGVPIRLVRAIDRLLRDRATLDTQAAAEMVYPDGREYSWRHLNRDYEAGAAQLSAPARPIRGSFAAAYLESRR